MKCYKCRNELPRQSHVCPSCQQPVYTMAASAAAGYGRRLDGCIREQRSPADYTAAPNVSSLPPRVDLRPACSPVEDQGQVGSCTANAVVGAFEFQRWKAGKQEDLSRLFVYYNARKMRGWEHEDSGALISYAMAALLGHGVPPERAWPYDPGNVNVAPDDQAYTLAEATTQIEYARVDGIEHIKGALAREHPVVFAISLPMRCYQEAAHGGMFPVPTDQELAAEFSRYGTHAMLLVGYDTDANVFHVRNSWGADWGDQGYARLSIDTFQRALAAETTWILGSLEGAGLFSVTRPAQTVSRPSPAPVEGSVRGMAAKHREEISSSVAKDIGDALKDIRQRITPPGRQG